MSINAAYQPTVSWLPELAPSLEARAAALALFERQTGHTPAMFYGDARLGIWGFVDPSATLLFKVPEGWALATADLPVEVMKAEEPPRSPPSSSLRHLHRVTA